MYLIENPVVRGAFFPEEAQRYAVEPALASDAAAILAIARRHEGPQGVTALDAWWRRAPRSFSVVRRTDGMVTGLYCMAPPEAVDAQILAADPLAGAWID